MLDNHKHIRATIDLFYINETNTLKNHKEKVGDIMTSLKTANRRIGSFFAVAALALATITPGIVPAFASAAQVTERSVVLSSSSADADNVSYQINFTSVGSAAAFVVDFCSNTPLIEADCTAPAGFTTAGVDTETAGFTVAETTAAAAPTAPANHNAVVVTGTIAATTAISVDLDGINNPTAAGPLYARIITYSDATDAAAYVSADKGDNVVDEGSAAVSITNSVGVSGAVLETMTFCVSGQAPTVNCTGTSSPVLELGETSGDIVALSSSAVSEGTIYSQISTNAAGGAVVNLKSSAASCGGLIRAGSDAANGCGIGPAQAAGVSDGDALIGVKVGASVDPAGADPEDLAGTFQSYGAAAYYNDSVFKLNYDVTNNNTTGVTGPYGDGLLDTDDGPVSNRNIPITFGASISNQTPAGTYSANYSLIATGKF